MNKSISGQLFDVEKENIIWLIYLFIIGANFISNYFEEKYLYTVDEKYRKIFRYINILVLFIALCIYIYTTYVTYKNTKKDSPTYRKLLLLASICILIGGAIYLYVEVYKNANPEIDISKNVLFYVITLFSMLNEQEIKIIEQCLENIKFKERTL